MSWTVTIHAWWLVAYLAVGAMLAVVVGWWYFRIARVVDRPSHLYVNVPLLLRTLLLWPWFVAIMAVELNQWRRDRG